MPILQLIWSYCELVLSQIQTRIRISRKKMGWTSVNWRMVYDCMTHHHHVVVRCQQPWLRLPPYPPEAWEVSGKSYTPHQFSFGTGVLPHTMAQPNCVVYSSVSLWANTGIIYICMSRIDRWEHSNLRPAKLETERLNLTSCWINLKDQFINEYMNNRCF